MDNPAHLLSKALGSEIMLKHLRVLDAELENTPSHRAQLIANFVLGGSRSWQHVDRRDLRKRRHVLRIVAKVGVFETELLTSEGVARDHWTRTRGCGHQ